MSWTHLSACPLWEVSHRVRRGDNWRFTSKHVAEITLNAAVTNLCPSNLKMILSLSVTTATYFNTLFSSPLLFPCCIPSMPHSGLAWGAVPATKQDCNSTHTGLHSKQAALIYLFLQMQSSLPKIHRFWAAKKKKSFHFHINGNYLISICLALYPYIQYPVENTLTKLNILEEQKT